MGYTLSEVEDKINILADKLGSDFFPTPVIVNIFETTTIGFIGERLKIAEKSQEVSDDISNLVIPRNIPIILNPDANFPNEYIAPIPIDYMRLLSYGVVYNNSSTARRVKVMKNSQYERMKIDSNNKPNRFYPIVVQQNSIWKIDSGSELTPTFFKIVYCKLPSFADVLEVNVRIVNLSDEAIEKILLMVVTSLFSGTADQRVQSQYQIQEAFRKVFK